MIEAETPANGPLLAHFRAMALYNRRANRILYDACAALPEGELARPRAAFFGSILGTLNHILVGDRIWLARFEGETVPSRNLDEILHADFVDLRRAREREDARVAAFFDGIDGSFLKKRFEYVNFSGVPCRDPAPVILAHFFNHQTHHRGQVHGMLSQTTVPPPSLDLHRIVLAGTDR